MQEQRPVYHVAAAGLSARDVRLIEIVFENSQYNRFEFVLDARIEPERIDVLLANEEDPRGARAVDRVRALARHVPVVAVVAPGVASARRHAVAGEGVAMHLLPVLNRAVESEVLSVDTEPLLTLTDMGQWVARLGPPTASGQFAGESGAGETPGARGARGTGETPGPLQARKAREDGLRATRTVSRDGLSNPRVRATVGERWTALSSGWMSSLLPLLWCWARSKVRH